MGDLNGELDLMFHFFLQRHKSKVFGGMCRCKNIAKSIGYFLHSLLGATAVAVRDHCVLPQHGGSHHVHITVKMIQ